MLLLVTFLAPSESGRQAGREVNTVRGCVIVDKDHIWKLGQICSVSMIKVAFERCLSVDKIDF